MPIRIRASIARKLSRIKKFPSQVSSWISWKVHIFIVTLKSLFYTDRLCRSYMLEVMMEPMVWIVDHFTKVLGPILVGGVVVLTSTVVSIVYWLGLPHYRDNRPYMYLVLMPYGHWLLINVIFHFYMACITEPGSPLKAKLVQEVVGVCKKCVAPKPPRTHHCSVCNKCILKMDHHCPWINNCVGHFNHRYFFMYMIFMIMGSFFIMMFGAEIAHHEIWLGGTEGPALRDTVYRLLGISYSYDEDDITGYPVRENGTHLFRVVNGLAVDGVVVADEIAKEEERRRQSYWVRFALTYAGLLTAGSITSLGLLSWWHSHLICAAETSVEQLINKRESKRLADVGQVYRNPYHFGRAENWRIFLGIQKGSGRSFWRHVLLPSTHPPLGTGLSWPTRYHDITDNNAITSTITNTNDNTGVATISAVAQESSSPDFSDHHGKYLFITPPHGHGHGPENELMSSVNVQGTWETNPVADKRLLIESVEGNNYNADNTCQKYPQLSEENPNKIAHASNEYIPNTSASKSFIKETSTKPKLRACSRDRQNIISRSTDNLITERSDHYKAA